MSGLSSLLAARPALVKGTRTDPALWLDRCAALFRDVRVTDAARDHPALPAVADAWPVLRDTLERYPRAGTSRDYAITNRELIETKRDYRRTNRDYLITN